MKGKNEFKIINSPTMGKFTLYHSPEIVDKQKYIRMIEKINHSSQSKKTQMRGNFFTKD